MIADRIRALVDSRTLVTIDGISRPVHYGDIMLLLRQRTHAGAYESALRDRGIPTVTLDNLERDKVIYGALGGVMTVLIRNIGAYVDGVIFAILLINLINPLVDKIRPKAIGKVA